MDERTLIGYRRNGRPIFLARGGAQPEGEPPPAANPDADELAALRKEKADREAAAKAAADQELADLRKYKEEKEAAAARAPKPATPRADKPATPAAPATPPPAAPAGQQRRRGRSGASGRWFGYEDE